jgi:preprotein translocase subunit YajC
MFFALAFAAETATQPPAADGGFGLLQLAPLILIFVVFYVLLIRPQQKKVKEHKALVSNVRRGDRVSTQGGIIGQVTKVISDTEVQVEISEGVRVRMQRGAITDVLTKSSPPSESAASEPAEVVEKKGKGR